MRTDAELLRSHDADAFGELYGRHVTAVAAYLGRRSRQADVTFDLLGETFARAFEHRQHYDPRKGPAIAWLLGIARSVTADAERRGQVSDAARARVGLEPIALDDAALGAIAARSRVDLAEALASLPESQRIAVFRRVLADDDYDFEYGAPPVSPSPRVPRQPPVKRGRDPFDVLGERLFLAAGGQLARSRSRVLAIAATALTLFGAGVAAAALTLGGDEPPPSGPGASPTPTPTLSPTPTPSVQPGGSPDPNTNPFRRRVPRATPGPGSGGATPVPIPTPTPEFDLTLTPDLSAGHAGWCVGVTIKTLAVVTGGRQCHRAGAPGTTLIAAGGVSGSPGVGYVVVDRAVREVRLDDGRSLTPERDRGVPAGWRVAMWDVTGRPPTFTLHGRSGQQLAPRGSAAIAPRAARRVDSADPPRERCAIRAKAGSGLKARNARLLQDFATLSLVSPSYLSCASTSFTVGTSKRRLRAAVLLNPRDLGAPAPPLPSTSGLAVRREGPGWLVVSGGTKTQRDRVLRALSVTGP